MNAFAEARIQLTQLAVDRAVGLMQGRPSGYIAVPDAPSTYESVRDEYVKRWSPLHPFRVSSLYCENTIYTCPEGNHAFRFWHDVTHVRLGCDFSRMGEYEVAMHHICETAREYGYKSAATKLMRIDTLGQLNYYHKHGKHVANQLAFATEQFHNER